MKLSVVWKENYFEPHLVMTNNLSSYQREWLASLLKEGKNISVIYMCKCWEERILGVNW